MNSNASVVIEVNSDSISKLEEYRRDSIRNVQEKRLKLFKDSLLIAEKKIQYPNNDRSILFPFFKSLQNAKNGKVRIMHYGDSQIEADRISGRLRERLQREFGGYGSGAYAVIPATRKISIRNKVSTNWKRFTGFGPYIDTSVKHKNYGALFSFCKIIPDSNELDTSSTCNGLVKIFRPKKSYKHCRNYQQINFYYSSKENINIKYVINDTIFYSEVWDSSYKIKRQTINFSQAPESFEAHFKSKISPLIYGISTEGTNGVVVDNIPLRGASGTEFGRINYNGLKNMHELLSPDLFILEFGGNAIAHIKTKSRAQKYGNYFKRQINKLKKINPNAIVLLIGPGDMAKKENTQFYSQKHWKRKFDVDSVHKVLKTIPDSLRVSAQSPLAPLAAAAGSSAPEAPRRGGRGRSGRRRGPCRRAAGRASRARSPRRAPSSRRAGCTAARGSSASPSRAAP